MTTVSWFAAALIALMPIAQPASTFKADPPKACDDCDDWNRPRTPDKVFGTTYNVGVAGLSSVLITSPAGHILLDGGLPQSAPVCV